MLTHPTVDKLHELRCPAMARALTEQLASPQVRNLSFEERLGLLVDREITERHSRQLTNRLTLTVVRLGLTGALHRTLRSTNAFENLNGSVERYTRNVKRWRGGEMIQRWVSAALLDAEQRFRRVRGFRDMPRLMLALDDPSARFKQPGMAA